LKKYEEEEGDGEKSEMKEKEEKEGKKMVLKGKTSAKKEEYG
jgi:hypothetical protein